MDLNPHDLVRIQGIEDLFLGRPFPDWVQAALLLAPYAVVRRAEITAEGIPGGVRGAERGQRCAAWIPVDKILEVITPDSLVYPDNWKAHHSAVVPATIQTLREITPIMQATGYKWGPTGSTGFELATGIPSIKNTSDLDLVINLPVKITIEQANMLLLRLEKTALVRLDVQLNTPAGGVALKEYILGKKVLVKTSTAPILQEVNSLWS